MMHLIAIDDQVSDRGLRVGAVYGYAKSVASSSGSIAAFEIVLNVMDVVFQQFYVGTPSGHIDPQGSEPMFGGAGIADFETLNSHVTFVLNRKYADSSQRCEMPCVQDRCLAWIASE